MTVEKQAEVLERLKKRKREFNEQIDRRIAVLEKEHEMAVAASVQRAFSKNRLSVDELMKLKNASRKQLQMVLEFINTEIEPEAKEEIKNHTLTTVKETNEYAKDTTT